MGSDESGLNEGRGLEQSATTTMTTANFPQKFLNELVTFTTLSLVLFAGLNLMAVSLFEEQVDYEETGKLQFNLNLAVVLGLSMILSSIAGLVLNCQNKLPGKVREVYANMFSIVID